MTVAHLLFSGILAAGALNAAFIEVAGTASGTFGSSGTNVTTSGSSTITYVGSTFSGFLAPDLSTANPSDYILGIGTISSPPANINNFGSFTVDPNGSAGSAYNDTFVLNLSFFLPTATAGNPTPSYTAAVQGTVFTTGVGGVTFDFPTSINLPNLQYAYTFASPACAAPAPGCAGPIVTGDLAVSVNDLTVQSGSTSAVTGTLNAQVVPEPGSYALFGIGLSAVGLLGRWKR